MADRHTESDFCACHVCCQWRERLHAVRRERDEARSEVEKLREVVNWLREDRAALLANSPDARMPPEGRT